VSRYQKILCCLDLDEDKVDTSSAQILEAALALTDEDSGRLHVVHICEHPITGYGEATGSNLQVTEAQIRQHTYPRLKSILQRHLIPVSQGQIAFGQPSTVIHQLASELSCDLIIVGGHEKSVRDRLLGSTSRSVLQGAPCDVLAVKIEE
jgi:universal stress protein A